MSTGRARIPERQVRLIGILALAAVCVGPATTYAQNSATLTPAFRRALDQEQPGWRVAPVTERIRGRHTAHASNPEPNVLVGDFDGNGHEDRAVLVVFPGKSHGQQDQLIVLLQMEDRIRAVRVDEPTDADPNRFLSGRARGAKLYDLNTNREFVCRNEAISVDYDCCGCATHVFDNGRFESYWTCD